MQLDKKNIMVEQKFIKVISKILNKNIIGSSETKLSEIHNIDSLDYVKLIIGLKEHGIILSLGDLEKLTIHEILDKSKK